VRLAADGTVHDSGLPDVFASGSSPSPNTSTCRPDMAVASFRRPVRLELFCVATIFAKG
jgi:hypothetical protein